MNKDAPIGIFDSGLGGLSVLRRVREELPSENIIYYADSAHIPYGEKSLEEIRKLSLGVTEFLLEKGCKMIVIACNTASAAALKFLREEFPHVIFVGMEPAVKPAAEQTQSGIVGVIATAATFQGELFASVIDRFAQNVTVLQQPCPGLVRQIENGETDSPQTEEMLRGWLEPMKEKGIDALVLGCTHYPFVEKTIAKILGPGVQIIDPAPAVARRIKFLLGGEKLLNENPQKGRVAYFTSGDTEKFSGMLEMLLHEKGNVRKA
ncbi:MAG TPA: glutamate racemase [Bacteroidia bacterium]|nr:glutamate racemase [Bacteroidia bacterium]